MGGRTIKFIYGTAFWSIKAQIGTRPVSGEAYRSEPFSTKKQCHMHILYQAVTFLKYLVSQQTVAMVTYLTDRVSTCK